MFSFMHILRKKPLVLALLILVADMISKFLAQHLFLERDWYTLWYPYGGIGIFKDFLGVEFSLVYTTNRGAAWGILADFQEALLVFRILLILGMVIYAFFINKNSRWNFPLAMIIAGALGNVIDFFIYGHVIDMLHFVLWGYDFPVFNLADTAIFLGVMALFAISLYEGRKSSSVGTKKPAKSGRGS